jgi:hypothetical protein
MKKIKLFQNFESTDAKLNEAKSKVKDLDEYQVEFLEALEASGELAHSSLSHGNVDMESLASVMRDVQEWRNEINGILSKLNEYESAAKKNA